MKQMIGRRTFAALGAAALLACLYAARADSQDPKLKPTYGSVDLKAGFEPDPFKKEVVAGGPIKTNLGKVDAYVSKEPDFQLNYTAGNFPLTFYVEAKSDTTLLINLPDGKWVADDDGGGNLNPKIVLEKPQSGRYDIFVGTFNEKTEPAVLHITELKK